MENIINIIGESETGIQRVYKIKVIRKKRNSEDGYIENTDNIKVAKYTHEIKKGEDFKIIY